MIEYVERLFTAQNVDQGLIFPQLQLSEFIAEVGQAGYGKTRREIITLAENVVCDKGMLRGSRVTSGWFRRFM